MRQINLKIELPPKNIDLHSPYKIVKQKTLRPTKLFLKC